MLVIENKPLIFLDAPTIDELSVEFRRINKMLEGTMLITHSEFSTLQDLIDEDSAITYGIVKCGEVVPDGVPVIKVESMRNDRSINTEGLDYVSESISNIYSRTILKSKDILISIKGTIGRIAEVPGELEGANITRDSALIRLRDKSRNSFMMLYLESELAQLQMTLHSRGAAVKGINLSDLRELKVPKITSENQDVITQRYLKIQYLHERLTTECYNLLQIAHTTTLQQIDLAFANELGLKYFIEPKKNIVFLRNTSLVERLDISANHPDYTSLIDQIKSRSIAGTLADLVEVSEKRFDPRKHAGEEVCYLAIGDIDGISNNIIKPQVMFAEELPSRARRLIHEGDILVGIAGASTGTENMVVFPVSENEEGWIASTGFIVLRPVISVPIPYVCHLLKPPFILRQIRALLTSPSMPTINEGDLLELSVPVSNELQRLKTLEQVERLIDYEKKLTIQLNEILNRAEALLKKAKSNIFDLLDEERFTSLSEEAEKLEKKMQQVKEALQ